MTVEELVETDDATIVTSSTTVVVVEPERLRASSKRFASMRGKKGRDRFSLASLNAEQKREFESFRDRMKKKPANHPLRQAADKGDDALIDALVDGKGDLTVTTTAVIPKQPPIRTAKGTIKFRTTDDKGDIDMSKSVERPSRFGGGGPKEGPVVGPDVDVAPPSETIAKGSYKHTAKFLTGFTEADDFIWETRWD